MNQAPHSRRSLLGRSFAALLAGVLLASGSTAASQQVPSGGRTAPSAPAAPQPKSGDAPSTAREKRPARVHFGTEKALPKRDGTLRLASYNAENLFDHADDPTLSGEFDDKAMATASQRCEALAAAIRAVDADVIGLQEIESLEALRWFRDTYLADMGYRFIASQDVGYYRGVEQAILSRHPIVRTRVWPDADLASTLDQRSGDGWSSQREGQGDRFQRSPLFAQVRTPEGYLLDLFVVHHKAGGKDFAFHREAEALKIIELVKERLAEDPNARIAVLGDFNAAPSEKSVKIYLDPAYGGLANAWEERFDRNTPRDTFVTHASGRVIDYILASPALREDFVPKSFFVLATLAPAEGWNWRTDPHPAGYASDHRPIVIDVAPRIDGPRPPAGETAKWDATPGTGEVPSQPGARPPAPGDTAPAAR